MLIRSPVAGRSILSKVLRRLNPGLIIGSYLLLLIFRFRFIILLSVVNIWRGLMIAFVDDYPR